MRYAVTIDLYVHADSDAEAIAKTHELTEELHYVHDNHASVLTIHLVPFGSIQPGKLIYPVPYTKPKTP